MTNADREAVAALCVHIFSRIQSYPRREEQLVALATAFVLMCKVTHVRPSELWEITNNIMFDRNHPDQMKSQFAAMQYYLEEDCVVKA